jgi:hypothetical protein
MDMLIFLLPFSREKERMRVQSTLIPALSRQAGEGDKTFIGG